MSLIERLESVKPTQQDHHDITYLKTSELGRVVNRGLAELYKIQPKNPVTFLANWLLNESRSNEIKKKIEESNQFKSELKEEYKKEQQILQEKIKKQQEINQKEMNKRLDFLNLIKSCKDYENNMNIFCETLKNLINATGVYVLTYDKKRKLPISEEEDETAHLLEEKVLRYIYYCQDHEWLLKNKYLEASTGVTYDLIIPREESNELNENKQLEENLEENSLNLISENKKEVELKNKEIKEVVGSDEGQRVKFFNGPRLGCYLAIDMSFKTSLMQQSLISSIENLREYEKNLSAMEERKREWEAQMAQQKEKMELDIQNNQNNQDENQNQGSNENEGFVEEKVELLDFYKEDKRIIFSLDTLGQDRTFNEKERSFIFEAVMTLKTSWEKLEENLLLQCRDLKIEMDSIDKNLKELFTPEKIEQEEEKFIKEHFETEFYIQNPITDEKVKMIETEFTRSRYIIKEFLEEDINKVFLMFAKFEFVEYERLFQNTLYFIGINNTEINEENTNKLDWRKARKFWNGKVLDKLRDYVANGPKNGVLPYYSMGNRILINLETINKEDLRNSSFVLSRLLDLIILLLKVRKDDIIRRRDVTNELMEKRKIALEQKNELMDLKEKTLEEQRRMRENVEEGMEVEPLDEEEFLRKFDEEHPPVEIPDEVFYDIDEDMDVDKLSI